MGVHLDLFGPIEGLRPDAEVWYRLVPAPPHAANLAPGHPHGYMWDVCVLAEVRARFLARRGIQTRTAS